MAEELATLTTDPRKKKAVDKMSLDGKQPQLDKTAHVSGKMTMPGVPTGRSPEDARASGLDNLDSPALRRDSSSSQVLGGSTLSAVGAGDFDALRGSTGFDSTPDSTAGGTAAFSSPSSHSHAVDRNLSVGNADVSGALGVDTYQLPKIHSQPPIQPTAVESEIDRFGTRVADDVERGMAVVYDSDLTPGARDVSTYALLAFRQMAENLGYHTTTAIGNDYLDRVKLVEPVNPAEHFGRSTGVEISPETQRADSLGIG